MVNGLADNRLLDFARLASEGKCYGNRIQSFPSSKIAATPTRTCSIGG